MVPNQTDGSDAQPADVEGYDVAANHPLTLLLAPEARTRILMALVRSQGEALTVDDICEIAGVSRDSWYVHRDWLLGPDADQVDRDADETIHFGVIERTRKVGNASLYRARMDDPIVERLREIADIAGARRRDQLGRGTGDE